MNISKAIRFQRVSDAVAAGQTLITSSAVDSKGYDTCCFIVAWGAITTGGVQSVKVQQSQDDSSYADLAGSSVSVADSADNTLTYVEIARPRDRYLKCLVSRATQDSAVDGIFALCANATFEPVTQHATVSGGELHHAPSEGTA